MRLITHRFPCIPYSYVVYAMCRTCVKTNSNDILACCRTAPCASYLCEWKNVAAVGPGEGAVSLGLGFFVQNSRLNIFRHSVRKIWLTLNMQNGTVILNYGEQKALLPIAGEGSCPGGVCRRRYAKTMGARAKAGGKDFGGLYETTGMHQAGSRHGIPFQSE